MSEKDLGLTRPDPASSDTTPATTSHERLLSLLELAEKGSSELDGQVWLATRVRWSDRAFYHWRHMLPKGDPNGTEEKYAEERAPKFTTSLDAALTLVPEAWRIAHLEAPDPTLVSKISHLWHVVVSPFNRNDEGWVRGQIAATAKTGPLAIVIAAIKARSA